MIDPNCYECNDILGLERELDKSAIELTEWVWEVCKEVRDRNNARWRGFESAINTPLVGSFIYNLFKAPSGLEPEPDYSSDPWYRRLGKEIESQAVKLEELKAEHMIHFGDELVHADFFDDPRGYYEHFHPHNPMKREDAYKKYLVNDRPENLIIHIPDKYDFSSGAGVSKNIKGRLVVDDLTKRLVPEEECDFRHDGLSAYTIGHRILRKISNSHLFYSKRS